MWVFSGLCPRPGHHSTQPPWLCLIHHVVFNDLKPGSFSRLLNSYNFNYIYWNNLLSCSLPIHYSHLFTVDWNDILKKKSWSYHPSTEDPSLTPLELSRESFYSLVYRCFYSPISCLAKLLVLCTLQPPEHTIPSVTLGPCTRSSLCLESQGPFVS